MGDNIYEKKTTDEDMMNRFFYQCPINSTHNTLIRHRSLLRESVMSELNCRVIEIVLSTLKYPVFMEIDMKGHEAKSAGAAGDAAGAAGAAAAGAAGAGDAEVKKDCNPTEGICKIRHGFTGTSNLLDFLKTVCHAYSKCFVDSLKPYPLILGFDVTGTSECDTGIFKEITKLINNCNDVITSGKSLICGKTDKIQRELSGSLLTTLYGDAEGKKKTTETPETLSKLFTFGGAPAECSEKTLKELMGKIILRCKGKTLVDKLKTNDICHIDYKSSLKIQVNTFNKVKYPKLNYDSTERKLLRVYPGFNANIRALSYQKTISDEIKKRLNQLFNKPKSSPEPGGNIPASSSSAPKGVEYDLKTEKFVLKLGDGADPDPQKKKELKLFDLTPETDGNITTCYGHDILKYINIASYNYPLDTEKDESFQELDKNFYNFYNKDDAREKKYNNLVKELVTGS